MNKFSLPLAFLLLAAPLALAEEPAAATPSAPQPPNALSRASLGVFLSYWNAEDLDGFDADGFVGGGVVGQFRLLDRLSAECRVGAFGAGDRRDVFVPGEGWFENTATVVALPLEAGLVASLMLSDSFSVYGGPGVGFYVFDAEFSSEQGRWKETFDADLDDVFGFYALLGARAHLARNVSLFAEAKYSWVETDLDSPFPAGRADRFDGSPALSENLDFGGLSLQAGALFSF